MKNAVQNRARLSITIHSSLNFMIEKIQKQEARSKSAVIEEALEEFVKQRLAQDAQALSKLTFDDLPSEDEWLQIQSKI